MRLLFYVLIAFGSVCAARAEEPYLLRESRLALGESIPQVALQKLGLLLGQPQLAAADRVSAQMLLSQALAMSGKQEEALGAIQTLATPLPPEALLLRAGILAQMGKWKEARPLYHTLAAQPGAPLAALLGEAEAWEALGNLEDAAPLLEKAVRTGKAGVTAELRLAVLLAELGQGARAREIWARAKAGSPEETKWRSYTEGRLLLFEDQSAPALSRFEALLQEREHVPESLLVAATFGATDARISLHGSEAADAVLETFIWRYPSSAWLEAAFRRLDQVYEQEEDPPEMELHKWAQKPQTRRAALARFYAAKMQVRMGKWDKATVSLQSFLSLHPEHPLQLQAHLLRANMYAALNEYAEEVRALEAAMRLTQDEEIRANIELRTGLANFQQGEFLLAATLFEAAGRHAVSVRPVATFNAALAWLHQRNFERFHEQFALLAGLEPQSELLGELLLEEGLVQARSGDVRAVASLRALPQKAAHQPRLPEAKLALAELTLLRAVPGAPVNAESLRTSAETPLAPDIAASADYLAVFQADAQSPRNDDRVIALAQKFLRDHPGAEQTAAVRLKLGQVYFRREDFANAETQFGTLASESPQSPHVEAALYLAGQSAMHLINPGAVGRALQFFERVVRLEGNFKLYARQQQALVQSRLEHEDQAIALYETILTAEPPPDGELRHAALCGKGDNLLALGRRELPQTERIDQALEVYRQLAAAAEAPAVWRNQALYKAGKALEQLGRNDEALAAYYDVLNRTTAAEREYFWFFKAGFDAGQLCEQQEQWKSAAGIYQKMAKLEGPRTAEAQSRLRKLRLEHFLWE